MNGSLPITYCSFLISLNSITRSRFIGYNLSLLQHPFISAAKLQIFMRCSSIKILKSGLGKLSTIIHSNSIFTLSLQTAFLIGFILIVYIIIVLSVF